MKAVFLLQETTQSFTDTGGGIAELTQAIASGVRAGMPDKWMCALRCLILRDDNEYSALKNWLLMERERWPEPKRLTDITELAINDYLSGGRGEDELRYKSLGIGKTIWYKDWKTRYADIYNVLARWVEAARGHIMKGVKE